MTAARCRRQPSGRFLLRMDPGLHALLQRTAKEAGMSLNQYCLRKLESVTGGGEEVEAGGPVVKRAAELFSEDLVAVALYGSWARDDLATSSDVDMLVVLEPSVALTRELYRRWDRSPLDWQGRPLEPHFVHLPEPGARVSGLFAEVAVDGIVLFERGLRLSRRLVAIRREIADGSLVRRQSHGQPYWIRCPDTRDEVA